MKIKTTKGTINNNTTKHKITRDTATIFNFNIDQVTLNNNTLTVTCTTITDETITYTLDLASGEKELPTALENLNVAGDINLFLAIAYKLYETGLEPKPVTGDTDYVFGVLELADTKIMTDEGSIDIWQEAEDKSVITLDAVIPLGLKLPSALAPLGTAEQIPLQSSLKINNTTTTNTECDILAEDEAQIYYEGINDIPVAEDHLLVFECTINNPTGDDVTINATLNLDTKEWIGGGGFY